MRLSDCPPELKILVADMLTAYDNYKQGHAGLFAAQTLADLLQASRGTVENYLENRLIWKELNHYKENGSMLCQHPIFAWIKRTDEIRQMNTPDLVTLKINHTSNIDRNKGYIRKQPNHPLTLKRQERIKEMEQELKEVNRQLNFKC